MVFLNSDYFEGSKMIKNLYILFAILIIFRTSSILARHLDNKSDSDSLRAYKYRMGPLLSKFQRVIIAKGKSLKKIKDKSKPNEKIRKIINRTDLLSVLFYDGNAITVNELSSKKLDELDKMYSMSIVKSYVGYLTEPCSM